MAWLRRLLPLRVAPGIALIIVLAVLGIQAVTGLLFYALTPGEIQVYGGRWLAERVAESAREVLLRPKAEREQALAGAAIDGAITLELVDRYDNEAAEERERRRTTALVTLIRRGLGDPPAGGEAWQVEVSVHGPRRPFGAPRIVTAPTPPANPATGGGSAASPGPSTAPPPPMPGMGRRWDFPVPARFTIAVRGPDGQWLLFVAREPWATVRQVALVVGWLALAALVIGGLSWLAARRVIQPLEAVAQAADRMATVREPAALPERGPPELRAIARRLNDMQTRLRLFVDDRTQMIAAISHDLRTPLTRMRLRAEFVEDPTQRQKMLDDIGQMETIVVQTLDFARQDATVEPTAPVDLATLLESLCDDVADSGGQASYVGPAACVIRGQPAGLRRAFANLVDNAVAYGERADVVLARLEDRVTVTVRDRGPGLPPGELERVFRPFYRLEASRSRDTGGTGLGLSIARSILRAHGGDVALANADPGLVATVTLPLRP
jgi:signal transduction histidine kinase